MKICQNFSLLIIKVPKYISPGVISNMPEFQFIKYQSPKIYLSWGDFRCRWTTNGVSRLISPVKMPHRWQFLNRWPHQWRFCHRWCHHNSHHRWHRHRCNLWEKVNLKWFRCLVDVVANISGLLILIGRPEKGEIILVLGDDEVVHFSSEPFPSLPGGISRLINNEGSTYEAIHVHRCVKLFLPVWIFVVWLMPAWVISHSLPNQPFSERLVEKRST